MVWGAILALPLALAGFALWWPFYRPNLEINAASSSVNISEALPASFSVTNTGVVDAYGVDYWCFASHIHVRDVYQHDYDMFDFDHGPNYLADTLSAGQPIDFACPGGVRVMHGGDPNMFADIEVVFRYRAEYSPRYSFACRRFITGRDTNGELKWFRRPALACAGLWQCLWPRHVATIERRLMPMQDCRNLPIEK